LGRKETLERIFLCKPKRSCLTWSVKEEIIVEEIKLSVFDSFHDECVY
jgi:hypothetical protein